MGTLAFLLQSWVNLRWGRRKLVCKIFTSVKLYIEQCCRNQFRGRTCFDWTSKSFLRLFFTLHKFFFKKILQFVLFIFPYNSHGILWLFTVCVNVFMLLFIVSFQTLTDLASAAPIFVYLMWKWITFSRREPVRFQ